MRKSFRGGRFGGVLAALLLAFCGVGLIVCAPAVTDGIGKGLSVCATVLIPALFPFLVLSCFLAITDYARILSAPLGFLTEKLFKLPREFGVIILLSLIGGYPVGAKMVSSLLAQGRINEKTASRMLCFCVNSGPSFVITAVGTGMLHSRSIGVVLYIVQAAVTLLIGVIVSLPVKYEKGSFKTVKPLRGAAAFVQAVSDASGAMLAMCAYAVLFSGIIAMVEHGGIAGRLAAVLPVGGEIVSALISGLFEVTTGCLAAAKAGGIHAIWLSCVSLSFCGLSVIFQVMACFGGAKVRFVPFILSRLGHCVLSVVITLPLYKMMNVSQMVWLPTAPPAMYADGKTLLTCGCLLAMCSILVLSVKRKQE